MKERYANAILKYLSTHDSLTTPEAEKLLSVSAATARRIFNDMADTNTVLRTHGGIKELPNISSKTIPFKIREQWQSQEKELLAKRALQFAAHDSTVFVHSGTTTMFLTKFISSGTFITDSVTFAELLARRFPDDYGPEVILTGGSLDRKAGMLYGHKAESSIKSYHADFMITSVRGLNANGLLETSDMSVGMQLSMMDCADFVIVIADQSKFQRKGSCFLAHWDKVDVLITTENAGNEETCKAIRQKGTDVITMPCPKAKNSVSSSEN